MRRPLLLVLFVLCVGSVLVSPAWADRDVSVPRVEGLDIELATRRLESAHLQVAILWTAEGHAGRVQAQQPARGERVPRGTIVELVVTRRMQIQTIVPDLVGLGEDEVIAVLEDVYVLEVEERPVHRAQVGRVVATEPHAGSHLPLGGVLRLLVGRERHRAIQLPLPDVRHMTLDEAEGALLDLGLVPVPTFVRLRHGAHGRVRRQVPEPGARVVHGTRIELEVGIGRGPARRVRVPSLYGLDLAEAGRALESLGLGVRVERLPSRFAHDAVIRQKPLAGTSATLGSVVRLVVAFPSAGTHMPARVPVPQLAGLSLPDAFNRARQGGIQLELRRHRGPGRHRHDVVLAQRPSANVAVPLGTVVRIEVPFGTVVPDLVGLAPEAAALRALEAGLRLELDGGLRRPRGLVVVAQVPEAGTVVPRDAVVRAVVARDPSVGLVLVPQVGGFPVEQARARLRSVGLHVVLSGPPIPAGATTRVVSQSPQPGARTARGSTVQVAYRLAAAAGPGYVLVPDLVGRSLLDAHRVLAERGLAGLASTVRGPGPKGVTGQDPAPGTRVRRGVKVRFTVRR